MRMSERTKKREIPRWPFFIFSGNMEYKNCLEINFSLVVSNSKFLKKNKVVLWVGFLLERGNYDEKDKFIQSDCLEFHIFLIQQIASRPTEIQEETK